MKQYSFTRTELVKISIFLLICYFLPNCLAYGFAEPAVATASSTGGFWLWKLLGRLHPLAVHFPVTLLCLAAILEVATFRNFTSRLRPGIDLLVLIGAAGAVIAAVLGLLLAGQEDYAGELLSLHRWTGVATAVLSVLTAFVLYIVEKRERWNLVKLYRGILIFTAVGVTAAGHYGASLTHGDVYLTSVMPWSDDYENTPAGEKKFTLVSLQEGGKLDPAKEVELSVQVRAIFAHSCYKCHSSDKIKGELRLDQRDLVFKGGKSGPIIIPGQPEKSEIIRRITLPRNHKESMPGKGKALSTEDIALITYWIKKGAPWPDKGQKSIYRVAELKPRLPTLPPATKELQNPVDLLVNQYFTKSKTVWPKIVSDRIYLRRIYLDIIGIVPSPEELQAFMQDTRPDKRGIWVRQLLNRKEDYALNWLTFWNDALRNDYTGTGYITNGRYNISDWLYKSLENNKPYNQFVKELLNPTEESKGFISGIQWRGVVNASQRVEMQAAQNVSQVFLGLNLKCASCHDSFVSDWKLADAYAFANVFADTTLEINRCDVPTGKMAETRILWEELGTIDKNAPVEVKLKQLAENLAKPQNGRLYRTLVNRVWAQLMGRGMVAPVDAMDNEPWSQDLLDWLASDFVARGYDVKELIYLITTSKTYQLPSVGIKDVNKLNTTDYKFTGMLRRRLSAEQFADAVSRTIQPVYADSALQYNPAGKEKPNPLKTPFVRASLVKNDGFLTALGRPNRETVLTSRESQANLLQAMELTNGKKFNEVLKKGADTWISQFKESEVIIREVYKKALGRAPLPREMKVAKQMLGTTPQSEAVQDFLWAIVLLPEFQFIL
ncbi:PSD1 and planctomycete cytochrome C domain-containing protein [Adhaeribacter radiodurans]|uniref:DUF1549 domain-containing protein n=1 Tax=Adhaeribacter radiodurans TaxID=2745197 RepID=A0A7L7L872_9BACT|nr:PSD1 and planctomycete cytochrome C domain-containing protein [Adhaeribacter radiodurans]QMU28579.1 DUF1549 domain-containing protein [Adhaeribacter radiodurans]